MILTNDNFWSAVAGGAVVIVFQWKKERQQEIDKYNHFKTVLFAIFSSVAAARKQYVLQINRNLTEVQELFSQIQKNRSQNQTIRLPVHVYLSRYTNMDLHQNLMITLAASCLSRSPRSLKLAYHLSSSINDFTQTLFDRNQLIEDVRKTLPSDKHERQLVLLDKYGFNSEDGKDTTMPDLTKNLEVYSNDVLAFCLALYENMKIIERKVFFCWEQKKIHRFEVYKESIDLIRADQHVDALIASTKEEISKPSRSLCSILNKLYDKIVAIKSSFLSYMKDNSDGTF